MYYLLTLKTLSSGSVERNVTPYNDADLALRKFHEAFNVIGGGPTAITAILMEETVIDITDAEGNIIAQKVNGVSITRNETWSVEVPVNTESSE